MAPTTLDTKMSRWNESEDMLIDVTLHFAFSYQTCAFEKLLYLQIPHGQMDSSLLLRFL